LLNHCGAYYKMTLRALLQVTLLCFLSASLAAEQERRVTSNDPKQRRREQPAPEKEAPRQSSEKSEKNEPPSRQYSLSAKMTLGSGKTVRGQVRLSAPEEMQLNHESGGVRYSARISPDQISSVEILKWKHRFVRENKAGLVYEFIPDEVRIRLKDGGEMRQSGPIFPFLKQFNLENKNGKVTLFTFWVDLKKPDGSWHTGLTGPESGIRVICHPEVVRRIDFD
jgi:hypothetical protein